MILEIDCNFFNARPADLAAKFAVDTVLQVREVWRS